MRAQFAWFHRLPEILGLFRGMDSSHLTARPSRNSSASGNVAPGNAVAISLIPGELRIEFRSAEGLAPKLVELSQAMAHEWNAFILAVEE